MFLAVRKRDRTNKLFAFLYWSLLKLPSKKKKSDFFLFVCFYQKGLSKLVCVSLQSVLKYFGLRVSNFVKTDNWIVNLCEKAVWLFDFWIRYKVIYILKYCWNVFVSFMPVQYSKYFVPPRCLNKLYYGHFFRIVLV